MRSAVCALLCVVLLSGCASWATYNKQRDFDDNTSGVVFVDAKQRAVISNTRKSENSSITLRRFCAEPSPDALSAFAANAGLNLSMSNKGDLGYNQAFSEGAASIGLRTQSIQLLRDVMFTNCEAFINDAITDFGLETMQRRFQSTMVAVLAIEQLTGVGKPQQVALGGRANSNDAEVLASAIKLVADTEAAAKQSKTQLDAAKTDATSAADAFIAYKAAHADDTTSDDYNAAKEKSTTANGVLKDATTAYASHQADVVDAKAVRTAATSAGGGSGIAVSFAPASAHDNMSGNGAAAIATAVSDIVKNTLQLGFGREVCTTLFGQFINPKESSRVDPQKGLLSKACLDYMQQDVILAEKEEARYLLDSQNQAKALELIDRSLKMAANGASPLPPDDLAELIDGLVTSAVSQQKPRPKDRTRFSAGYEFKKLPPIEKPAPIPKR